MLEIQQKKVDDIIPKVRFACDITTCKGACCTLSGGMGAPLLNEEIVELERSFPVIKSTLPQEHLDTIVKYGIYEGEPYSYTTRCCNNRACVFVTYEEGIARCSIEKAFIEGKLKWRKPLSCHLFPIRVDRGIIERLRYERIFECNSALYRGEREQVYLADFLKEPLIRAFGISWYMDFQLACVKEQEDPR